MKEQVSEAAKKPHTISVENCQKGTLTGVTKVISSNETALLLDTNAGNLQISGAELKINKFDVAEGLLTFEGAVTSFRYAAAKVPLLKRIFK